MSPSGIGALRRSGFGLLPMLLTLHFVGCAPLESIPGNVCGNAVVEAGEDCDTYGGQFVCIKPGESHACHYRCKKTKDGTASSCPEGKVCNAQEVCVLAPNHFEPWGEPLLIPAFQLDLVDFDGDGRDELLLLGMPDRERRHAARVYFFDADGQHRQTYLVPTRLSSPATGNFSGGAQQNLAFPYHEVGVGVLTGRADRTLWPESFPTLTLPEGAQVAMVALPGLGSPTQARETATLLLFYQESSEDRTFLITLGQLLFKPEQREQARANLESSALFTTDQPVEDLVVLMAVQVVENQPVGAEPSGEDAQILLAFRDTQELWLVWPRQALGASGLARSSKIELPVPLPERVELRVVDLNHDQLPDLLLGLDQGTGQQQERCILYGYGDGTGKFFPESGGPRRPPGLAQRCGRIRAENLDKSEAALWAKTFPPLVADLNQDGWPDLLTNRKLLISVGESQEEGEGLPRLLSPDYELRVSQLGSPWTMAVMGDFNGDGRADVAAAVSESPDIDLLMAADDGNFFSAVVPTAGVVQQLATAELDGDGVTDLLFIEAGVRTEPAALSAVFGWRTGIPTWPTTLARQQGMLDLQVGSFERGLLQNTPDGIDDVWIRSQSGTSRWELTLLEGAPTRQLLAPLPLTAEPTELLDAVPSSSNQRALGIPLVVAQGHITSIARNDLIIFAHSLLATAEQSKQTDLAELETTVPCLWLARADPETMFQPPQPVMCLEEARLDEQIGRVALVAGDLDRIGNQSGLDELVILYPAEGEAEATPEQPMEDAGTTALPVTSSRLRVVKPDPSLGLAEVASFDVDCEGTGHLTLLLLDLNRDGFRDLATTCAEPEGSRADPVEGGTDDQPKQFSSRIRIFWNNHAGSFLPPAQATTVQLKEPVLGLAPGALSHSHELLAITREKLYRIRTKGVATTNMEEPEEVDLLDDAPGGQAVAAGDINGDGLEDLAVSNAQRVRIYRSLRLSAEVDQP